MNFGMFVEHASVFFYGSCVNYLEHLCNKYEICGSLLNLWAQAECLTGTSTVDSTGVIAPMPTWPLPLAARPLHQAQPHPHTGETKST